jgi:hypothetical protein
MEQIRELKNIARNQLLVLADLVLNKYVLCRCSEIDIPTQQLELERIQGVFAKDLPLPMQEASEAPSQILSLREGERVLHYIGFNTAEGENVVNNKKFKLYTTSGLPIPKETL